MPHFLLSAFPTIGSFDGLQRGIHVRLIVIADAANNDAAAVVIVRVSGGIVICIMFDAVNFNRNA